MKKFLTLLFYLFIFALCSAYENYSPVQSNPILEPWRWQKFPELSEWAIQDIAESPDGNIWFAAENAIIRYDGVSWTFFTKEQGVPERTILSIDCDKDGILYAICYNKVIAYNNNHWETIYTSPVDNIRCLTACRQGGAWIGTHNGIILIQKNRFKIYATEIDKHNFNVHPANAEFFILPDSLGIQITWDALSGIRLHHNTYIIDSILKNSPADNKGLFPGDSVLSVNGITNFYLEQTSKINTGEKLHLIVKHKASEDTSEIIIEKFNTNQKYSSINCLFISEGINNELFYGLLSAKSVRLSFQDHQYHVISQSRILFDNSYHWYELKPQILQDKESSLWIAAHNHSIPLIHLKNNQMEYIWLSQIGGSDNHIFLLETIRDELLVGGYGCLQFYNGKEWYIYRHPQIPIPSAEIQAFSARDGSIWIFGRESEVLRLDYSNTRWLTYEGLNYECSTRDGTSWYISHEGTVIQEKEGNWIQYTQDDGLMSDPAALYLTKNQTLWAIGSDHHIASTAVWHGEKWLKKNHTTFSWGIDYRAIFEDRDGLIWFGANIDIDPEKFTGGIISYNPQKGSIHNKNAWNAYYATSDQNAPMNPYGIGQDKNGHIYVCGKGIFTFDGNVWQEKIDPLILSKKSSDFLLTTPQGELWFSSRGAGVFHFNGTTWKQYTVQEGLSGNSISSILLDPKGNIWCSTVNGISRFDGHSWIPIAFPSHLKIPRYGGLLKYAPDHAFWINIAYREWYRKGFPQGYALDKINQVFKTTRFKPDTMPPVSQFIDSPVRVSQPGNTFISWKAIDPWRRTPDSELKYSYQIDKQPWSIFTSHTNKTFLEVPPGMHTFKIRARDSDFNVETIPKEFNFYVDPPLWRKPWFQSIIFVLLFGIGIQTYRLLQSHKNLKVLNEDLEDRVKRRTAELESINQELESFSYSVSHDLKAPLRSIIGFSEILAEEYSGKKLDAEGERLIRIICENSERMRQLIEDLLAFSRLSRKEIHCQLINMDEIVHVVIDELTPFYKDRKINFKVEALIDVPGDSSMIRQIFMNLISNAIKFSKPVKNATIHIYCEEKENHIIFHIKDNGVGFDMQFADKLFGVFQRLHGPEEFEGTGIGLSLVQRIIHKHNGTIWAESTPNKGAQFSFSLPKK